MAATVTTKKTCKTINEENGKLYTKWEKYFLLDG